MLRNWYFTIIFFKIIMNLLFLSLKKILQKGFKIRKFRRRNTTFAFDILFDKMQIYSFNKLAVKYSL
jgi:hypothetical protein